MDFTSHPTIRRLRFELHFASVVIRCKIWYVALLDSVFNYLYKVKVDVEVVSFVWFEAQIGDWKISVVPSYHKIFGVVDEESVLESKTQFKYQTIVAKERPNAEGEIVCEDGPCIGSWVVFPPQIGQIHKRHLRILTSLSL